MTTPQKPKPEATTALNLEARTPDPKNSPKAGGASPEEIKAAYRRLAKARSFGFFLGLKGLGRVCSGVRGSGSWYNII